MKIFLEKYMIKDHDKIQPRIQQIKKQLQENRIYNIGVKEETDLDRGIEIKLPDGLLDEQDFNTILDIFEKYTKIDFSNRRV